jgi:spoIIIJ-associated protein
MSQTPREILDTMLGYLGFISEIKEMEDAHGPTLMIYSSERDRLIGRHGETLDDIQFLINRILQARDKDAPRIGVDVEHYRQMREDQLVTRARQIADLVKKTGRPFHLDPMNSYDRWVIHNAFKDDPEVMSCSPKDDSRVKRITLKPRTPQG